MILFREYVCPQCGYPMCNLQCSSGQNHRLECEILSRCKAENRPKTLQIDGMKETNAYAIIAPLRLLLLLEANGDEWMRSNQLMDHQKGLYLSMEQMCLDFHSFAAAASSLFRTNFKCGGVDLVWKIYRELFLARLGFIGPIYSRSNSSSYWID